MPRSTRYRGTSSRRGLRFPEMMYLLVTRAPATRAVPKKALRSADRIKTMLQFVQTHYAEDLTVEQIAASASISPASACGASMI